MLADISGIIIALLYMLYVTIFLVLGFSNLVVSLLLLGITAAYVLFALVYMIFLNRRDRRPKKMVKLICRYTKYFIQVINAIFVVAYLIGAPLGVATVFGIVGVVFLVVSLIFSLILDLIIFSFRLTVRNIAHDVQNTFDRIRANQDGITVHKLPDHEG